MIPTDYIVTLAVYKGANKMPEYQTKRVVHAETPLSALSLAEAHENVSLPPDRYAAARSILPYIDPRPAAGVALVEQAA